MADENKRIITREFLASVLKKIVNKIGLRLKKEDAWKNYYKNLSGNIDLNKVIETGKYIYNGSSTSVLNIPNTSLKEADDINEYQIGARDTFMLEVYSTKDTDSVKRLIQVIYIGNFGEKKVFYRYTKNPNKNETDTDWVWSKWNTGFGGTTEIVCINGKNIDTELKGNVTFFSVPGYSQDYTTVGKGQGVLGTLPSDIPNIYDIPNYTGQEPQISSGVINGYQLEDNYQTIQVIYINGKSYRRSKWLKHEYFNGDVPAGKNKINIEMSDWTEWTTQPTRVSNSLNTIEAGTVPSTKLITQNNNIISKLFSDSLYLNNTDDNGNYNSFNKFPLSRATKNGIYWAGNKFYICTRDYSGATISAPNDNFEEFSLAKIFDKVNFGSWIHIKTYTSYRGSFKAFVYKNSNAVWIIVSSLKDVIYGTTDFANMNDLLPMKLSWSCSSITGNNGTAGQLSVENQEIVVNATDRSNNLSHSFMGQLITTYSL